MPRSLVLDWDKDRCLILVGNPTRSGIKIERAVVWPQEEITSVRQAEEAGKTLRDFLKTSGVAAGPVLICVPRQRVLLKEIRCPTVSADDEPGMVRFQAAKELLETPEDVVLDYTHTVRSPTENQILVAALRKDLLLAYQALCRAAGLKLAALTPRSFVLGSCLARARKLASAGSRPPLAQPEWSAVLLQAESWAELTILKGGTVFFSRALADDVALDAEVRRSLTLFAAQAQGQFPQVLYLIDKSASVTPTELDQKLQASLSIPVVRPSILAGDDPAIKDVNCAAAIGLLTAWGEGEAETRINFAKPKEPKVVAPVNRKRLLMGAGVAVVLLLLLMIVSQQTLASKKAAIQDLVNEKEAMEKKLKGVAQERLDLDGLKEWEQTSVPWIDEFYELAARFPQQPGFRLTKVHGEVMPPPGPKDTKDKTRYVAKLTVHGLEPPGKGHPVHDLLGALKDNHIYSELGDTKAVSGSDAQEFFARIYFTHQPPENYVKLLKTGGAP